MTAVDFGLLGALVAVVASLFGLAMIEASLLHLRRSAVATRADDGDRRSRQLLDLLDDLPAAMNAVLLAVLLLQVTATSLAGVLAQRWFGGSGITIATVAVTVVLFVYGEAIPKTIAIGDPLRYARRFSRFIRLLTVGLRPVVSLLVQVARWQSPDISGDDTVGVVTEDELLHLADEAVEAGEIEASDAELIGRSFTLGDRQVGEILIPMVDVVSVAASTPVEAALRTALEAGHRRLLVHGGHTEDLLGFVRLRDLASAVSGESCDSTAFDEHRPALRVDSASLAIDVLHQMQQDRCHLAIVTSPDSGVVEGIVTVEDIVEELLGDIDDPHPTQLRTPPLQPGVQDPPLNR